VCDRHFCLSLHRQECLCHTPVYDVGIRVSFAVLLCITLSASAQYVPPVPRTVTGGRALHRTTDIPLPSPKQQWVLAHSSHFLTLLETAKDPKLIKDAIAFRTELQKRAKRR